MVKHKISDEELLAALESGENLVDEDYSIVTNVPEFLQRYDINPGDNVVPISNIYQFYCWYTKRKVKREFFISILLSRFECLDAKRVKIDKPIEFFIKKQELKLHKPIRLSSYNIVQKFISRYKLKKGLNPIPVDVLYYKYLLFCELDNHPLIGYNSFENTFRSIISCRRIGKDDLMVTLLDMKLFDIFPKEVYTYIINEGRKYVKEQRQKRIKDGKESTGESSTEQEFEEEG